MTPDVEPFYRDLKKNIYNASKDKFIRTALRRAVKAFREARDKSVAAFPEVKEKKKLLRQRKEYVIDHLEEMAGQVEKALSRMNTKTYFARTADDALKIMDSIVGTGKTVVKAKSITSEELDMNHHLEATGNTVYETDLGEFIVQLLHGRPMHILAPAVNVPREKVAEVFSKLAGRELSSDPTELTMFAREYLRDKYFKADIGISGANAITADTGSVFLIENEGNIRFATNAPPVHIVLVGLEKILPTLSDGMLLVEVVTRYAGYYATSYVSIITGPAKTGDIEKVVVYGAHGPKELHVILLDNGRTEMAKDPILKQALYCTRCGPCMYECPVYPITTGHWGYRYMGGIGIPWTAFVSGGLEKAGPMAFACALCGRCAKFCPLEIDGAQMTQRIREILAEKGMLPKYIADMAENVLATGSPYKAAGQ
jgi:L-lactate dehydrogenase complex protein LldG